MQKITSYLKHQDIVLLLLFFLSLLLTIFGAIPFVTISFGTRVLDQDEWIILITTLVTATFVIPAILVIALRRINYILQKLQKQ